MIILLLTTFAAIAVVVFCLRRRALVTLFVVGLLGFAHHLGMIRLPRVISAPVANVRAAVREWQDNASSALICEAANANPAAFEDRQTIKPAEQTCSRPAP